MMSRRSCAAESGVRFVQKYCSELIPTTGMPFAARFAEICLSIFAQPPSPETKTTSVSDVPCVAGTSMRGNFAAARKRVRRNDIGPWRITRLRLGVIPSERSESTDPLRLLSGKSMEHRLSPVVPNRLKPVLHRASTCCARSGEFLLREHSSQSAADQRGELRQNPGQRETAGRCDVRRLPHRIEFLFVLAQSLEVVEVLAEAERSEEHT